MSVQIIDGKKKSEGDRSYHPEYIRKKAVRVRVQLSSGATCIGMCHVLWPDGRVSDEINDDRPFLPLTDVTVQGDSSKYDILTINKKHIELLFEIHKNHRED